MRKTHTFLFTSFHILLVFEYFVKDFEDLDLHECEDVNMTNAWLSQVRNERKHCFEDQRKANKVMIKRYTKRNRIAEYNVGEIVYIFNAESKSRKGKKILGNIPDWFPVKDITRKTKYEENKRIKGKAVYFSNWKVTTSFLKNGAMYEILMLRLIYQEMINQNCLS